MKIEDVLQDFAWLESRIPGGDTDPAIKRRLQFLRSQFEELHLLAKLQADEIASPDIRLRWKDLDI